MKSKECYEKHKNCEGGSCAEIATHCRYAIQCPCPDTGIVGDFAFVGASYMMPGSRISPIFHSLTELFKWLKDKNWEENNRLAGEWGYERKTKQEV